MHFRSPLAEMIGEHQIVIGAPAVRRERAVGRQLEALHVGPTALGVVDAAQPVGGRRSIQRDARQAAVTADRPASDRRKHVSPADLHDVVGVEHEELGVTRRIEVLADPDQTAAVRVQTAQGARAVGPHQFDGVVSALVHVQDDQLRHAPAAPPRREQSRLLGPRVPTGQDDVPIGGRLAADEVVLGRRRAADALRPVSPAGQGVHAQKPGRVPVESPVAAGVPPATGTAVGHPRKRATAVDHVVPSD